jgi:hypothetical protein
VWALGAPLHATAADCEALAVSKDGKPLAGAARASFIRKCVAENRAAGCAARAIGRDGKPLAGAARASFIRKCETDAGGGGGGGGGGSAHPRPTASPAAMAVPKTMKPQPGKQ